MTPDEEQLATAVEVELVGPEVVLARRITEEDKRSITRGGKQEWLAVVARHGMRPWLRTIEHAAADWTWALSGRQATIVLFLEAVLAREGEA